MQNYKAQSSDAKIVEPTVTPSLAEPQMSINTPIHLEGFPLQTRLYTGEQPHQLGNSYATCLACLINLDDPEAVFQVQEHYHRNQIDDRQNWLFQLIRWLQDEGYDWNTIPTHLYNGRYYMVIGQSPRGRNHVCIYQNGKLVHDPHPDGNGLLTEDAFEVIDWLD